MRVTARAAALAASAFAAVVLASACSSTTTPTATLSTAPGTPATSAPASSAPPATTPPATTPPATPVTSAPPVFTTAEAAAKHLYNAWKAGDKAAALQGASQSAVDALFSEDWKAGTYFFGGCSDDTQCQYNWAQGAINMTISGNASSGFIVTGVDRGNAG